MIVQAPKLSNKLIRFCYLPFNLYDYDLPVLAINTENYDVLFVLANCQNQSINGLGYSFIKARAIEK